MVAVAGLMVVATAVLALSLTGLVGFPYNSAVGYHGVGPPRRGVSISHPERATVSAGEDAEPVHTPESLARTARRTTRLHG